MITMRYAICTLLLFTGGFLAAQDGEPTDLDRMQGTWVVVSLTEEGKAVLAKDVEELEIVIEKNTYTAFDKGMMVVKYEFKLDATKKPKEIDLTYLVGLDKGKTVPAIYKLGKEQFTICLDEEKKNRPKVFESKENETSSVLVLKKKPKKDS